MPAGRTRARVHGGDAALGHRHFAIEIRNSSTATCTLDGYPAVGFRDARGRAVAASVAPGRSFMDPDPGATPVTLAPDATALATIGWDAGAGSGDPTLARELVLRIDAGGRELSIPSGAFDVVQGTSVTVQAWHAAPATSG
ncbi:DUF4232 domain-containing protein [Pseudolysinimonas kribbensis]|uniref:DUF4232 domain-containing protein n=1 Tax=Pseudolysinimonas kribbensis TaxID=433641 RepID=UPI0024E0A1B0|nr:DUF4232 domain-containing protein [Pseudolysinimonas kribbensis]